MHLPEEILTHIVGYLQIPSAITIGERRDPDFSSALSESDKAVKLQLCTLACLSRTSKALHRIVKPILYHTYPGFRLTNARTFTRTLAKDSICADSIREIVIDKWEHIARGDEHSIDRVRESLDHQCLQYAQGLRRPSSCYPMGLGSAIGAELESGRADVVLTMLVLLCDNINVLEVSVPCVDEQAHREEFLRGRSLHFLLDTLPVRKWTSTSHTRYQKIRNLAIRLEKHSGTFGCAFAKQLLMMPNVETFSAWRISCSRLLTSHVRALDSGPNSAEHPWPGLRAIELRQCKMDNVTLAYLFRRAPNLRSIDIQWAVQEYPLSFRSIAASLNTFGTNLESVRLDTRNNFCNLPEADPHLVATRIHEAYDDPLGNLQQMTNLVHLAVTPRALVGSYRYFDREHQLVECFPAKLKTLAILGPTREDPSAALTSAVLRHIEPLMAHGSPSCPELKRIELHCATHAARYEVDHWQYGRKELLNLGPIRARSISLEKLPGHPTNSLVT